jgi:hypothetical protein
MRVMREAEEEYLLEDAERDLVGNLKRALRRLHELEGRNPDDPKVHRLLARAYREHRPEVADMHAYEEFGTRMSERLLLSLGYFSDEELEERRRKDMPLPPASLWVANNMRRPFALVGNAIASMRTLRGGNLGARVQEHLGLLLWGCVSFSCSLSGISSSSILQQQDAFLGFG